MGNGRRTKEEASRLFRQRVRTANKRADEAFKGKYKGEIAALLGLSGEDIAAIKPGISGMKVYAELIEVVKEASRVNMAQAEFRKRIEGLGETAVAIARKVVGLAGVVG